MNLELIVTLLMPVVSAYAAWVFARRKNSADAQASELDNVDKAATIWRNLSEQLESRLNLEIQSLRKDNSELKDLVNKLSGENEELEKKMKALASENKKLIEQLRIFNQRNSPEQ